MGQPRDPLLGFLSSLSLKSNRVGVTLT
jgi:hypothetical protein